MKKTINKYMAAGALAILATACTGDYIDINSNQFQPGDLRGDGYALSSSMSNVMGTVVSVDVNCNQFTDCLQGGTLGGYFSDGNANFRTSFARYNAPNNWTSVFLTDKKIISTLFTNLSMIKGQCAVSGDMVPMAIALVCKVATMSRVTDTYGPIPYGQIGYEGIMQTPYDSQAQVYDAMFADLDEAIAVLSANSGAQISSLCDYVYQGSAAKWLTFANSLKLRLAMRISYANPTLAKQMAEQAVAAGVMESNDQSAHWNYFQSNNNPMYVAIQYNAHDSRVGADITCYMNGYNDPRRSAFFTPSLWTNSDGSWMTGSDGTSMEYIGVRRGWETFDTSWGTKFSDINLDSHAALIWMNASEVAFLRAEGAAVFGWNMGGTAESFYNKGITLSFEQYGATGANDYLADDTSVPAAYTDPSGVNPWNGSLPAVTIKWDESATTEQKQERIMIQKYIANWTLGNETWADIRRTGYPKLIPVAYNGSGGVVDSERGPQRLPYPQSEYSNNGANVQAAVANYLNGPDTWATPLWWACKPNI